MASPQNTALLARQYQQLANVPPDIRQLIASDAINSQKSVLAFPYYSTLTVQATGVGTGTLVYTVGTQELKAFNYAQGNVLDAAGFTPGTIATAAETNLLLASSTRDNADVMVWGMAAYLTPDSDPLFAQQVWRNSSIFMSLSGTDTFQVGRLEMLPAAGGLYGQGVSKLSQPPIANTFDVPQGFVNNGNPQSDNYMRFPNAIRWNANGSGQKDTSLVVKLQINKGFSFTSVARSAATGVSAYVPPATANATIVFRLVSVSISERSQNT